MRFYSSMLLKYVPYQELKKWQNSSVFYYNNVNDMLYQGNKFWLKTYTGYLFSTANFTDFSYNGKVNTETGTYAMAMYDSSHGFTLCEYQSGGFNGYNIAYYLKYATFTPGTEETDTIGTPSSFSTSSSWSNCHITSVEKTSNGFVVFGFKKKTSENVGIYSIYTSSFSSPTEMINMPAITKAKYLDAISKHFVFGTDGYVGIGDVSTSIWSVSQVGDGTIDWVDVATNGSVISLVGNGGYSDGYSAFASTSSDGGETWSTPRKLSFRDASCVEYANGKFYLFNDSGYASSSDGLAYYPYMQLPVRVNDTWWRNLCSWNSKLVVSSRAEIKYLDY